MGGWFCVVVGFMIVLSLSFFVEGVVLCGCELFGGLWVDIVGWEFFVGRFLGDVWVVGFGLCLRL